MVSKLAETLYVPATSVDSEGSGAKARYEASTLAARRSTTAAPIPIGLLAGTAYRPKGLSAELSRKAHSKK